MQAKMQRIASGASSSSSPRPLGYHPNGGTIENTLCASFPRAESAEHLTTPRCLWPGSRVVRVRASPQEATPLPVQTSVQAPVAAVSESVAGASTSRRNLGLGGIALSSALQFSSALSPPQAQANKPLSSDWELVREVAWLTLGLRAYNLLVQSWTYIP